MSPSLEYVRSFVEFGKDCDQNGERMSKDDEKLPYLHQVTKKLF